MDAARRDRYLAALGVVRYRPRPARDTPAAPEPPRHAEPQPAGAARPLPAVPDSEWRSPSVLTEQVPPTPVEQPPVPAAIEPASPNAAAEAPVALRLACWQPVPDLLVLDALPPGGWPDRERTALLSNILRAIGRLPGPLAAAEVIDWPPFAGADATLTGARESLALFLAGRRVQAPFRWLLAMGEMSWRCLGAEPSQGAGDRLELDGAEAILLPGLAEMLASPELKAVTWRAIRPLAPVAGQ